ncbi:hypothetical protein KC867_01845, partial [Candidatus Saccharibacteria bacterium]|nr:hypothetical protein [Candidatus Saccharibacteria bacterium]
TTDGMMIIPNKVDGKSIAMSAPTGSTLANLIAIGTNNIPKDNQDQNYSYPMGLASFSLTDVGTGGTVTPSIFFETDLEPADVVVRKYYPEDGLYINLPNATVTKYTVANMKGLMVTYPITDGGELDLDNLANGSIIDPIGLATVTNPSLLNTGFKVVFPIILAIIIVSLGITTYLDYRKHKQPLLDMDKEMNTNIAKQYTYWHHMKVVTIPLAKYRISVRLERQDSVDDNAVVSDIAKK